jgi:hypothetical protein
VDTILGVPIAYGCLWLLVHCAHKREWRHLRKTGEYGDPANWRTWFSQLATWTLIVCFYKVFLGVFLFMARNPLTAAGLAMFQPLQGNPQVELVVVMVACPCLMNVVQFWIFDTFIKEKTNTSGGGGSSGGGSRGAGGGGGGGSVATRITGKEADDGGGLLEECSINGGGARGGYEMNDAALVAREGGAGPGGGGLDDRI